MAERSADRTTDLAARLEQLDELREHLVHVTHDAEVGDTEDRRLLVLVDRDDVLGALHTDHVLRRTGDAGGDVDVRLDDLAGLADLVAVRNPAGIDDRELKKLVMQPLRALL